jgi:hypothetical protein
MSYERKEQLRGLIQNGQIDRAIEMVRSVTDYHEGETFVFAVLREEKSTPELVEAVLEAFLGTRETRYAQHGYWVHSLSHFADELWKRRMDAWIKKFNEVAFKGANELRDTNCSDRLVNDFGSYAKFDDDPADFALTPENLRWMDWKYSEYAKARIEAGRFESEEAFLRWELRQPRNHFTFDYEAQCEIVCSKRIQHIVQKLQELGADVSEFSSLEKDLHAKHLVALEAKLSAATQDWERERLEKGIRKTREALAL